MGEKCSTQRETRNIHEIVIKNTAIKSLFPQKERLSLPAE